MDVALITGASAGLGRALANALAERDWTLIVDARGRDALTEAVDGLAPGTRVVALPGDVADPVHRKELVQATHELGRLDLLVNNASHLGPSPQPGLATYPPDELRRVYEVDVFAPLALVQATIDMLTATSGTIVNVSSDAAVEPYEGWGGYGSAKAALDQATAVLAAEHPALSVYAFDPGDMRTAMHQRAYPGEDISDRPEPETVAPAFIRLVTERPPSGRYRASDFAALEVRL
ncbi:MAG TPA: SDR family oxidoreductase [Actinomycetota bacterium]|nr:SDR family oxidoreductase [Actinomycetota bacterium]